MPGVIHLKRLQEILSVFVRFGFTQAIETSGLGSYLGNIKRIFVPTPKIERMRIGQRLTDVFSRLGPTFIKLGQFLSTRPDLIPESIANDLRALQDRVPPVPFEKIESLLKSELGSRYQDLYEIDPVPAGSASIAQVHQARYGDRTVVIKVQKPGVREQVKTDLEILNLFATSFGEIISQFRPKETMMIFERELRRELNFLNEYRNIVRFKNFFSGDPDVLVPEVYRELTTEKVLVMDHVGGVKITNVEKIVSLGLNPREIARRAGHLVFKQLFEFGFFHGDPHPGNLFIHSSGAITLLDFGIVGYLDDRTKDALAEILIGYLYQEPKRIIYALDDLGVTEGVVAEAGLERDLGELIDRIQHLPKSEIVLKDAVAEIIAIVRTYGLKFPQQLFLLGRSLALIEEIGVRLDPNFDAVGQLGPYVDRFLKRRYRAERVLKRFAAHWADLSSLLRILPSSLRRILSRLAREEYRFSVDVRSLDSLSASIERGFNRLTLAIISSAVVLVSVLFSDKLVIRIILFGLAFVLILVALTGMIHSRRL